MKFGIDPGRMLLLRKIIQLFAAVGLLALAGGQAQADTADTIRQLQTIRQVDSVTVIDTAAMHDGNGRGRSYLASNRAMNCSAPLTPLQAAIAGNPSISGRVPNLRSAYAARVEGARVYIYLGDPIC